MSKCAVPGCITPTHAFGYCDPHYRRFAKYGDPLGGRTANGAAVGFLDQVMAHEGDDCLLWPYAKLPSGHGLVHVNGRKQVVSRVICERAHGPPPAPKMDTAHYCRNTGCINPRHLRWATRSENQMDRVRDGTSNRGERHPNGKLTEEQIREIRWLIEARVSDVKIAQRYDVKRETIRAIRHNKIWSWLK